jgi:hypothetical protein
MLLLARAEEELKSGWEDESSMVEEAYTNVEYTPLRKADDCDADNVFELEAALRLKDCVEVS